MQVRCGAILIITLSACQFDQDTVGAGYYGVMSAGRGATAPMTSGGSSSSTQADTGAAGTAAPVTASSTSSPAATVGPMGNGASMSMNMASAPSTNASPTAPANATCDMSGRWLATYHTVTDALGQLQYAHSYHYYEIEQSGDALTIAKGIECGDDAVGAGDFAVTADFRGAWAAVASKVNFKGRKGTSIAAANGCKIDLEKWYTARGATLPYYLDPNHPLPTADDQAATGKPGWEDWDGDGNPGITGMVSGVVSGKIFVAPRMWTQVSGTAPDVRTLIKLPLQWNQEPNVMSYDGTPLLGSEAARAADMSLHFVQFVRLGPTQATGDDAAICKSVVALAPMLTPDAAGM